MKQDEICTCGHLKSSHNDALNGLAKGHGECKLCECNKFTWESFVILPKKNNNNA